MKRLSVVFVMAFLLASVCFAQTDKPVNTANKRFRQPKGKIVQTTSTDSIVITGTQVIPLLGRSEAGVPTELRGTWILTSLNGTLLKDTSGIHVPVPKKGGEIKQDSTTKTETINGVTKTTTEINIEKPAQPQKITPPQGSNYHIPLRPHLSFFGSNETFSGFTGCNKISGRYKLVKPATISFLQPAASTKMACIGDYDEVVFLDVLNKVNAFLANGDKLQLLEGSKILMEFNRQ